VLRADAEAAAAAAAAAAAGGQGGGGGGGGGGGDGGGRGRRSASVRQSLVDHHVAVDGVLVCAHACEHVRKHVRHARVAAPGESRERHLEARVLGDIHGRPAAQVGGRLDAREHEVRVEVKGRREPLLLRGPEVDALQQRRLGCV